MRMGSVAVVLSLLVGCGGRVDIDLSNTPGAPVPTRPPPVPVPPPEPPTTPWPSAEREGPTSCAPTGVANRKLGYLPKETTRFAVREGSAPGGANATMVAAADRTIYSVTLASAVPFLVENETITTLHYTRSTLAYYLPDANPYTSVFRDSASGERSREPGALMLSGAPAFDSILLRNNDERLAVRQGTRQLTFEVSLLDYQRRAEDLFAARTLSPKSAALLHVEAGPAGTKAESLIRTDVNFETGKVQKSNYPGAFTRPVLAGDIGPDTAFIVDSADPLAIRAVDAKGPRTIAKLAGNSAIKHIQRWGQCLVVVLRDPCDVEVCEDTLQVVPAKGGAAIRIARLRVGNGNDSYQTTATGLYVRDYSSIVLRYDFSN